MTYFTDLACSVCGTAHDPAKPQTVCTSCGKTLLARYDLGRARMHLRRESLAGRINSLWRYRELLPVVDDRNIVTLGEGWTPLLEAPALGSRLGIPNLFIKEEGLNPTGSFKARGLCLAVSKAKELGIKEASMPSAGNAGGALAAYAAKAGIRAHVFVPRDTPEVNIGEVPLYGGDVTLVDGVISDAGARMNEERKKHNWFDMSTMKEPYRLEGKKTMGYELAEQFMWKLPDVILYPTGGGTGLIGMWKAFKEMEELGWIGPERPRMISVQTNGCAPIVRAYHEGKNTSEFWQNASTAASGLRVPKAFADHLILDAVRESGGTAVAVSDEDLIAEMTSAARDEGIFFCPEGAAALSAAGRLAKQGMISSRDRTVVFNTGTGYKYTELFLKARH